MLTENYCRKCHNDKGSNMWYCNECWPAVRPTIQIAISNPDNIKGVGSILEVEGERKYIKRIENRHKILNGYKKQGKHKRLLPSQLRSIGA